MSNATVASLKDALLEELENQIVNGVTVEKDGEVVKLSPGAPVLAVAAKFVKDWADEIDKDAKEREKTDKLAKFLEQRRQPGTAARLDA